MARLDQLTAERAQQSAGDGRDAQRTKSANLPDRLAEQRIVREAAKKLRVVVIDRQDEAQPLDRRVALRSHHHRPTRQLPGVDDLVFERTREHTVEE